MFSFTFKIYKRRHWICPQVSHFGSSQCQTVSLILNMKLNICSNFSFSSKFKFQNEIPSKGVSGIMKYACNMQKQNNDCDVEFFFFFWFRVLNKMYVNKSKIFFYWSNQSPYWIFFQKFYVIVVYVDCVCLTLKRFFFEYIWHLWTYRYWFILNKYLHISIVVVSFK